MFELEWASLVSSLRSALDELRLDDLPSLADEELGVRLDELERAARVIESERARCLAEVERRGVYSADGHLSAAAWVAHRHGIPQGAAEAQVRVARALEEMPRVVDALADGEISTAAVEAMVRAREAAPEAFSKAEEALVESAKALSHRDLRVSARPLAAPRRRRSGGSPRGRTPRPPTVHGGRRDRRHGSSRRRA